MISQQQRPEELEKERKAQQAKLETFLQKDHELKVRYLSDHFQRMWTRFNFFVTIESALISGKFLFQSGQPNVPFALAGLGLSLAWYAFGAQDRFLVEAYRTEAQNAGRASHAMAESDTEKQRAYSLVGEVKGPKLQFHNISEWRWEKISPTRLAALFPLLVCLAWLIMLVSSLTIPPTS